MRIISSDVAHRVRRVGEWIGRQRLPVVAMPAFLVSPPEDEAPEPDPTPEDTPEALPVEEPPAEAVPDAPVNDLDEFEEAEAQP